MKPEKRKVIVIHLERVANSFAVWEMAKAVELTLAEEEMAEGYWLPFWS